MDNDSWNNSPDESNFRSNRGLTSNRGRGRALNRGRGRSFRRGRGAHVEQDERIESSDRVRELRRTTKQWKDLLPAFDLYYPDGHPPLSDFAAKIAAVESYMIRKGLTDDISTWEDDKTDYFPICVEDVLSDVSFCTIWKEFENHLTNHPDETITLWSAVIHKVIYNALLNKESIDQSIDNPGEDISISKIKAGFFQSKKLTPLILIKSASVDKFVTIRGTIIRTELMRPYCTRLAFQCLNCKHEFAVRQPDGKYAEPKDCTECKTATKFQKLENSSKTLKIDAKRIKLQDTETFNRIISDVSRSITCELLGGLTNHCITGDTVTLSGIVKLDKVNSQHQQGENLHTPYIETTGIKKEKDCLRAMGGHLKEFTNRDYYAIKEIHASPDLFRLLIASICPSILGHEMIKAGLLLCLFGGTPVEGTSMTTRSNINMLMIGDPGMGKSQMLKVATKVAPKAIYVCGTGTTVAGLTATIVREGVDIVTEPGALILADNGICCIDEFDKMIPQHNALREAMEQQSVTITKSGLRSKFEARTGVIAAANPIKGHYDKRMNFRENVKISPPLLSRFDLTFIMLDTPNKKLDQQVIDNMMRMNIMTPTPLQPQEAENNDQPNSSAHATCLRDKIKIKIGERLDLIPHVLIRKYIAYAKVYVKPYLTEEAIALIKRYYQTLRIKNQTPASLPVCTRQLESLVRLTQARAKLELREEANENDADEVLQIFAFGIEHEERSNITEHVNLSGLSNMNLGDTQSKSGGNKTKKFLATIRQVAKAQSRNMFSLSDLRLIGEQAGIQSGVTSMIDVLNRDGFLLQMGNQEYQLYSTD